MLAFCTSWEQKLPALEKTPSVSIGAASEVQLGGVWLGFNVFSIN